MIFRRPLLFLAAALSLTATVRAQTPLGQPTLDESKVQIWCATIRYVYDDAGRPELKETVNCASGTLAALAASIQPDSLRVYSLLFVPVEEKTNAAAVGKKDNATRLDALAAAIVRKLRASPARRHDPARMQRLTALEKALTDYARHGTPPGAVDAAMRPEQADSTQPNPAAPGPAEAAEARASAERLVADAPLGAPPVAAAEQPETTQDLLLRFAAPVALVLSILALVIFAVQRISMARWSRQQRRETLAARQAAQAAQAALATTETAVADTATRLQRAEALARQATESAEPAAAPDTLTEAQRREVERLVSQRVDEELRWLRVQLPELVAQAVKKETE